MAGRGRARFAGLAAFACLAVAGFSASVSSADVTIGANVDQGTTNKGTCGFKSAAERPCAFITTAIPGQTMASPCDGTVTRFRLNGLVRPANQYRLRVVRRNADGTFTGTASSAPVTIGAEGVNEYATSLPISAGEYIGVDFEGSTEEFGLRWVGGPTVTGVAAGYFEAFPADGNSAAPSGSADFYYLFNADVFCTPSNVFTFVKLKKSTVTLSLASAGAVTVADASAKATKAKPKLLKPSTVSGGPGEVKVPLKLSAAAKTKLKEKGKVKVRAKITFTPTGGTASTQVKALTVKKPKRIK